MGEALKDAVFENQANPNVYPNAGGLSIFGPSEGEVAAKEYENMAFTKDTHWNEALKSLGVKITEKK